MKSCPLVSIIMPVYNSEKYLEKSISSVLNQTLDSVELICINDRSDDDSLGVLKKFQKKDKRIKIINNKINVGPGKSRNVGIKNANGEYICFLDSDDWLRKKACEILYKKAEEGKADVVYIRPKLVFANKTILDNRLLTEKDCEDKDIVFRKNLLRRVAWAPWSKFIRRDLLVKNKIGFPDIYIAEDMDFSYKVIYYAKKITYAKEYLYNYNLREDSLMSYTSPRRRIDNYFKSIRLLETFLKKEEIFEEFYREFVYFKLYTYSAVYGVMYYSKEKIDEDRYRDMIDNDSDFKVFTIIRLGMLDSVIFASFLIKLHLFNPIFKLRESLKIMFGKWGKRNA